jgi:SHS2 domain-containing protein
VEQLMGYELIDHTADIGIRITEQSVRDLFETAGLAMFEQIADIPGATGALKKEIHVKGMDLADLLINWLRELLWCWTIDNQLIFRIIITEIDDHHLRATVNCDPFNPDVYEILKDIKAVTYHGASVEQTDAGWQATVIFDV